MRIPIIKPYFDDRETEAITAVLKSGWLVQGSRVAEFERAIADFTKAKFAMATTSCTTALHLALIVFPIHLEPASIHVEMLILLYVVR